MTRIAAIIFACGLTITAAGQGPFTTGSAVTYTLTFAEIGGNTNGALEPGESALVQISVAFSNQNTTAFYTPPAPAPGSGTIRGIGECFIDLHGLASTGNANGDWNLDFVHPGEGPIPPEWNVAGAWGTPTASGSIVEGIVFGQFPLEGFSIHTTNPINLIWQALWTPLDYSPRTVTFSPVGSAAVQYPSMVSFRLSQVTAAVVGGGSNFGSVSIPVIPSPSSALCATACLVVRARRRKEAPK